MGPTPDQLRKIERAILEFEKDWTFIVKSKEIARKPSNWLQRIRNFFWKRKHTVNALYWWAKRNWASERLIVFEFPIQGDNMPIKGFPLKYELQGGWTIPEDDLKYLKDGPLASEGLGRLLVPASMGWRRVLEFFKQIAPAGTILGAAVTTGTNWPTVLSWFNWLKNAF